VRELYDRGHQLVLLEYAGKDLQAGISSRPHAAARSDFMARLRWARSTLRTHRSDRPVDLKSWAPGSSMVEISYRRWALDQRLFLNPLNDLGAFPIAARDVLTAPSVVTKVSESAHHIYGSTNQLKQEYAAARYLLFEATLCEPRAHFSDKGVLLYDTLDYPKYGLAVEKIRIAFRLAYSLLDKVAFVLNGYLGLGIPEHRVTMKTIWYQDETRERPLKPVFQSRQNLPLRGLFWLTKDLHDSTPGFR
jgi:LA2681-like HEPN